jgi:hypothetical protein
MSGLQGEAGEPFHFALWVEMTALMEFLSNEERAALQRALGVTPLEYAAVSARYREELQAGTDPEKTAIFQAAREAARSGGREQAIERFNRFLDGLNTGA